MPSHWSKVRLTAVRMILSAVKKFCIGCIKPADVGLEQLLFALYADSGATLLALLREVYDPRICPGILAIHDHLRPQAFVLIPILDK